MLAVDLEPMPQYDFYEFARDPDLALVVVTAEQRLFANIILTIGVVPSQVS